MTLLDDSSGGARMQLKIGERLRQLRRLWHMPSAIGRIEEHQYQSQRANEEIFDYVLRRLGRLDATTENIQRVLLASEQLAVAPGQGPGQGQVDGQVGAVWMVEIPFVLRALAGLPIPSHLLFLGHGDKLLPRQLATLGHEVAVAGQHCAAGDHPQLQAVDADFARTSDNECRFDAIIWTTAPDQHGEHEAPVLPFLRCLGPSGHLILAIHRQPRLASPTNLATPALSMAFLQGFQESGCALAARDDRRIWRTRWDVDVDLLARHLSDSPTTEEISLIHAVRLAGAVEPS